MSMGHDHHDSAPEERLAAGKYVVTGELGRCGVGAVHKGNDQDLGRDVAMKFLHEKYKEDGAILTSGVFWMEAPGKCGPPSTKKRTEPLAGFGPLLDVVARGRLERLERNCKMPGDQTGPARYAARLRCRTAGDRQFASL
jgi:hypothetical protein